MTARKRSDIEKALKHKGFVMRVDGNHRFLDYEPDGKRHFFTKVSHGTGHKDIDDFLLSKMARQCHLSKAEFLNLVDCPMTQEDYKKCLHAKGVIAGV